METGHAGTLTADLLRGAFGADCGPPGCLDLPAGRAWLRAVALAGSGRFAAARALTARIADGPFASAARCLEASMLRQSGHHRAASGFDGAALSLAIAKQEEPASDLTVALAVDATVGLAADALGRARYALSARLLARADERLELQGEGAGPAEVDRAAPAPWWTVPRARLRRDWVAAELAVYSGDADGAAAAVRALLAADPGEARPRHHAKTLLIAGAAAMASGDRRRGEELATKAYQVATGAALSPLRWAGARILTGSSGEGERAAMATIAAALEADWIRDGADLAGM